MLFYAALFFSGMLFWTLLEYVLHRFLGHRPKGKNAFTKEHLRHHREGHYFAPAIEKAKLAVVILGGITLLFGIFGFWLEGLSFAGGITLLYLIYEMIHKRAHTHAPVGMNFYGRWVRRHHFYHHFREPHKNHGVTSPIWDIVFGTYAKAEVIPVPKALALVWLVDDSGSVLPQFQNRYKLV